MELKSITKNYRGVPEARKDDIVNEYLVHRLSRLLEKGMEA